jgi:hypothetical protein
MTLDEPLPDHRPLADKPIPLLAGLFAGCMTLALSAVFLWPLAWIFPSILGAATYPWARTRQFAVGSFAAACGAAVAALTAAMLFLLWP